MEESTKTDLLKRLAHLQTLSSKAVVKRHLGKAHSLLKRSAILIFDNSGPRRMWPLSFSVPLFLILFRAGYYLENEDGDYLYRYEAIPGQLANVCYFQLGLSKRDGSGYHPPWAAKKECAAAAHSLIQAHGRSVIVQSRSERASGRGREYMCSDVTFERDPMGYPSLRLKKDSEGKVAQLTHPRFFDWNLYQAKTMDSCDLPLKHSLDWIEESMVTTLSDQSS